MRFFFPQELILEMEGVLVCECEAVTGEHTR